METLRIKCPSCGVVLEVRNSKNEKVKRIACPNCKKQLAITFAVHSDSLLGNSIGSLYESHVRYQLHEGMNPIPHVASGLTELRVIRLAQGAWKHILRVLTDEQKVLVNGQTMCKDDEVVLLRGDEIQIDDVLFSFDKPYSKASQSAVRESPKTIEEPVMPDQAPKPMLNKSFVGALIIGAIAIISAWYYATSTPQWDVVVKEDSISVIQDTLDSKSHSKPLHNEKAQTSKNTPVKENAEEEVSSLSKGVDNNDYSLEVLASQGNLEAQFELGLRWITSSNCTEVVKGVKYLETAAHHGNSQAQYALGIVYHKGSPRCGIYRNTALARQYLQMAAQNGNEKAKMYLESNL